MVYLGGKKISHLKQICEPEDRSKLFSLKQQSSTSLAPETGFMEDNFSTDWGWVEGDDLGMIQAQNIFIVQFVSIIITLDPPQIIRH